MRMGLAALVFMAGACGRSEPIVVPVRFVAAQTVEMSRVVSYELWILSQAGKNGEPLSCEQLLRRALVPSDPNNIRLSDPIVGNFSADPIVVNGIPAGEQNRLLYIDLYDGAEASGERVAAGCLPSVTVVAGERNRIELRVQAP